MLLASVLHHSTTPLGPSSSCYRGAINGEIARAREVHLESSIVMSVIRACTLMDPPRSVDRVQRSRGKEAGGKSVR